MERNGQALTLGQLVPRIAGAYAAQREVLLSAEQISLSSDGRLEGVNGALPLNHDAWCDVGRLLGLRPTVLTALEVEERVFVLRRRLPREGPPRLRIVIAQDQAVGIEDARLARLSPEQVADVLSTAKPHALTAEQITIGRLETEPDVLHIELWSDAIATEPRPGDIINGGIRVEHPIVGPSATQVHCFLRRLVCENGAVAHICLTNGHARSRRLPPKDCTGMVRQLWNLADAAWRQVEQKLADVRALLDQPLPKVAALERAGFSKKVVATIELAMQHDELPPTGTLYDLANAMARVGTHEDDALLPPRQRRALLLAAGDLHHWFAGRCSHCGSFVGTRAGRE